MDELVAVGTAGLLGLVLAALLLFGIALWTMSLLWNAWITGNWWTDAEFFAGLALLIAGYTGTGLWLQKTGRI
jgi:hypothetical protein